MQLYLAEISLALEYVHEQGLVFRDLKLENILVDEEGHIRLSDFGMAVLKEDTVEKEIVGTPEYFAPEIIREGTTGQCVDHWAMGVVAFELLFARTPFHNRNPQQLFLSILVDEVKFPHPVPGLDVNGREFILSLLQKEKKNRLGFNGWSEIKQSKFFSDLDWNKVGPQPQTLR
jgi:serine/threonine protein kinase